VSKETHICQKRPTYTDVKGDGYVSFEKRPIYTKRDPYTYKKRPVYVKRDLHTQMSDGMDMSHLKRDPYIQKETHIHTKRDPYMSKETYIHRCQRGWICLI